MFRTRARRRDGGSRQSGYMLLLLMLAVAMLTITMLSVATNYRQSIRRDREVEMIHRGVQYERAVRLYYRKNNSYPPSVERLLETNKVRYLRKQYKDPFTPDGTWKIAHLTDINLPTAATGLGTAGTSGTVGSSAAGAESSSTAATAGQQGGQQNGAIGATGGESGGPQPTATTGAEGAAPNATSAGTSSGPASTSQGSGTGLGDQGPTGTGNAGPASTLGGAGDLLGGGAMIGVVSKSKQEGIHTFNEKSRYSEWLFVYLPSQDTAQPGHIPNGPFNPKANQGTGVQSGLTTPGSTQGTSTPGTTTPTTTGPTAASPSRD